MNKFKKQAIELAAQYVMSELNCTMIEAITKMQAKAAREKKEEILESLIEFKRELID